MQKIYILAGLPGSGKSTWARKTAEDDNTIIICRDDIRTMFKGKYFFDKRFEVLVKRMVREMLKHAIHFGNDIIIDETNINTRARLEWIRIINKMYIEHGYDLGIDLVEFPEPPDIYERRKKDNKGYTEVKWKDVINSMRISYSSPQFEKMPADIEVKVSYRCIEIEQETS